MVTDLVPEPKKEILSATLRTSSIRATDSLLGLEGDLPSATAAMEVRAVVALTPIVPWLIRGTLPISRLKIRVVIMFRVLCLENFLLKGTVSREKL